MSPAPAQLLTDADLEAHLRALVSLDPRLATVWERAGPVKVRRNARGFAGLAKIICGQQLSVASANAIWARFEALDGALDAERYLGLDEPLIRATGFSRGKHETLRGIAAALANGALDFEMLSALPGSEALKLLTGLKGVGPWTAEIYLLFCEGHPDVFPNGDLALQKAVADALGLPERPDSRGLTPITAAWSPHRGAAALLFWRYYAALRDREGIVL